MVNFIFVTACIALIAAFIILLIGKIGLREYVILVAPRLISKLFSCDFCLSFWLAFVLAILAALICGSLIFVVIPLFSTPITRILI